MPTKLYRWRWLQYRRREAIHIPYRIYIQLANSNNRTISNQLTGLNTIAELHKHHLMGNTSESIRKVLEI